MHVAAVAPEVTEEISLPPLGAEVRALLVWPRFPPSFWGFNAMLDVLPEKSVLPPLGLITVAALCPPHWKLRLIDRAFDELGDEDLRWANLVMISAMHAQREDAVNTLQRARALGVRTIIGGPFASSQPSFFTELADHLVIGEPDDVFAGIARDLEEGTAKALYHVHDKPELADSPIPRFDLLAMQKYSSLSVQFSRGCPFQCEFCDIITIYGRKPRTKAPSRLLAELDAIREAGWRKQVFIVDDNFIGNHKRALELALELAEWQKKHEHPFIFYTEASIDLAQREQLIDAMVAANFFYVFIGVETPDATALKEAKKFQNLGLNQLDCIHFIQRRGLWVTAGFIIGFDSDTSDIFDRQVEFIERSAILWAMTGFLQAPPTTPLFERVRKEGRLIETSLATSNFSSPNFVTRLPLVELLAGLCSMLRRIYSPDAFVKRAIRTLEYWNPKAQQHAPPVSFWYQFKVVIGSLWKQGLLGDYRKQYWELLGQLLGRWGRDRRKLYLGFVMLLSAHHFLRYARDVIEELESEIARIESSSRTAALGSE
jgi:radical SAM superfamily enzyme YgiQ (UPF0313 family)